MWSEQLRDGTYADLLRQDRGNGLCEAIYQRCHGLVQVIVLTSDNDPSLIRREDANTEMVGQTLLAVTAWRYTFAIKELCLYRRANFNRR